MVYCKEMMCLNSLRKSLNMPESVKHDAHRRIIQMPLNSYPTRLRGRCILTSRARGHMAQWRVSRIMFKNFADYNKLSGVMRAKW